MKELNEKQFTLVLGTVCILVVMGLFAVLAWVGGGIQEQLDLQRARLIRDARNCTPL